MKSTALNTKCFSLAQRVAHIKAGAVARAHTPVRYRSVPARQAGAAATVYFEAIDTPPACPSSEPSPGRARVLHVDPNPAVTRALVSLLGPAAHVTHVTTLANARILLETDIFALVVLDQALPDGARALLPLLSHTPLLVYSDSQPEWRGAPPHYRAKSSTARQLWAAMAVLLWNTSALSAGD